MILILEVIRTTEVIARRIPDTSDADVAQLRADLEETRDSLRAVSGRLDRTQDEYENLRRETDELAEAARKLDDDCMAARTQSEAYIDIAEAQTKRGTFVTNVSTALIVVQIVLLLLLVFGQ